MRTIYDSKNNVSKNEETIFSLSEKVANTIRLYRKLNENNKENKKQQLYLYEGDRYNGNLIPVKVGEIVPKTWEGCHLPNIYISMSSLNGDIIRELKIVEEQCGVMPSGYTYIEGKLLLYIGTTDYPTKEGYPIPKINWEKFKRNYIY